MSVIQNIWRGGYRATITSVYSFMILWEWYWAKDNKNPSKELASCEHMCESLSRWGRGGRRVTGDPRGSRGDEHSAQNFNLHRNSPVPQSPASSDLGQCRSLSALVTPLFSEIPISSITRFSGTFVTYCLPLTPAQLDYELSEGMNLFKMYQKKKKPKGRFLLFLYFIFSPGPIFTRTPTCFVQCCGCICLNVFPRRTMSILQTEAQAVGSSPVAYSCQGNEAISVYLLNNITSVNS